jgi:hypothetical protein
MFTATAYGIEEHVDTIVRPPDPAPLATVSAKSSGEAE